MQQIKHIMTPGVEHVGGDTTIQQAAELMAARDIGFLAVSDGQSLGGVLTDRDIVLRCLAQKKDPQQTTVAECVSTDLVGLPEDSEIPDAVRLMEERQVRRLVVTGRDGTLVGVISLGDLATGCSDDHLRAGVLEKVSA